MRTARQKSALLAQALRRAELPAGVEAVSSSYNRLLLPRQELALRAQQHGSDYSIVELLPKIIFGKIEDVPILVLFERFWVLQLLLTSVRTDDVQRRRVFRAGFRFFSLRLWKSRNAQRRVPYNPFKISLNRAPVVSLMRAITLGHSNLRLRLAGRSE